MSEKNMNWEFLANKDYAFLTEDPVLGDNVILLTYGGSHAYGTNIATSDVDIRGITFNPVESLLGNTEFEQFEDRNTDTVIYGLNKMIGLLLQCNPNCIEILGAKPEHYFIISPEGQLLLDKCDCTKESVAFGSPSTEHSVMCSNFAVDGDEITLLRRLLTEIYPNTSFSAVLDSYDYWNVIDNILPQLKHEILAHNGCMLMRGDSGDCVEVVTKTVLMFQTICVQIVVTLMKLVKRVRFVDAKKLEG